MTASKPVVFQDVASNIFNHTIQTSKEQCRKAEAKLKQVSPAAQDETYARVGAVGNGGVKNATLGREALAKDLNYAGLSQQFCTVSSDVATCIEIQKLFAQHASINSAYSTLSLHAQREIEAYGGQRQAAIAAYIQKYDPLPPSPSSQAVSQELIEPALILQVLTPPAPKKPTDLKDKIFEALKLIKKDVDLANQNIPLMTCEPFAGLTQAGLTQDNSKEVSDRASQIFQQLRELYSQFSLPARCMFENVPISGNLAAGDLHEACCNFFDVCHGTNGIPEKYLKIWQLDKKGLLKEDEVIYANLYLKSCQEFKELLPHFHLEDKKPVVSEEEFKKKFDAIYPKLPKVTLDYYEQRGAELEKLYTN